MVDLVQKYRKTSASEAKDLRTAQILTLVIGLIVTLMGILLSLTPKHYNLIDLQLKSFNCVLGPLGAIFMSGMLLRHVGQTAVIIAGITGANTGNVGATRSSAQDAWTQSGNGGGNKKKKKQNDELRKLAFG